MKLSDRIRPWWAPATWRDEHPEISGGEGYALTEEQRQAEDIAHPGPLGSLGSDRYDPGDVH